MLEAIAQSDKHVHRSRVWIESLTLSLSIPAAILILQFAAQKLESAWSATIIQRYCLSVTALCGGEWLVMAAFLVWWKPTRARMAEVGFARAGTISAWFVALGITFLSVLNGVNLLRRFGIPISNLWLLSGYHIYAALLMGSTAAFCEETIFRGFLMTEYAKAGYGKASQVVIPGLFFGVAHLAILEHGVAAGLGTIIPTAIMGMIWGVAFLLGRRSVLPTVVAHFINDATVLPWILFFSITHAAHH
ncbi:MAG: CPBP family intramembrane metalloprotease [Acidobacteriota bacterium]|nr:CPBP family intramembrane metalloprotease [Acidobacteriota bacterium]